ncbi:MAG: BatD family protein, partial [Rubricoccaceae bacterium]|nr:BatD family protein [Rubricoccaceae bacterium]
MLAFALGPGAAAQVSVNAFVDKTEVSESEPLTYTLEVRGDLAGLDPILPPEARGLSLASPAPIYQERASINGEGRLTLRWRYRPQAPGRATILQASVRVTGQTYRTDPIPVEVLPGGARSIPGAPRTVPLPLQPPAAASGELFVRAQPTTRRVVPGQQVVLDYVLYFEPHLRPQRSQVVGTWDAEGFWREELEVPLRDTYARSVTMGGRPYQAVTIRRIALFPTRTGSLAIGPMRFEVDLVRSGRSDDASGLFGSFFSRFDEAEVTAPGLSLT